MEQINDFILTLTQSQVSDLQLFMMILWSICLIFLLQNIGKNQKIFYAAVLIIVPTLGFMLYSPKVISNYYTSLNKASGYSLNAHLFKLTKKENIDNGFKTEEVYLKCPDSESIKECLDKAI